MTPISTDSDPVPHDPPRARPKDLWDVLAFMGGFAIAAHEALIGGPSERPYLLGLAAIMMGYGKISDVVGRIRGNGG